MPDFSRRALLKTAQSAAVLAALASSSSVFAAGSRDRKSVRDNGLIPYGAAVRGDMLVQDRAYREAVLRYCNAIVPESELKWVELQPNRGEFRFDKADALAAFAKQHGLALRGHTLVWYGALPYWTDDIRDRAEAQRVMAHHIETVVSRYRGQIGSWDVVNEPMPEHPRSHDELRDSVWTRHLGPDYLPFAFRTAAAADPKAQLVLNEYDIEFIGRSFQLRREGLLRVIRRLKDQGVPLHAIGLQAHLSTDRSIDRDGLQSFLVEIKKLGLKFLITELDVVDLHGPAASEARDQLVAAKAAELLKAIGEVITPEVVMTWGISDRYTWVPIYFKRPDGSLNRPLPLDDQMQPKPLMATIDEFRRRQATVRREG
jgi:endo-1,4-beta-xylanase